jgi:hypothetical protein
MAVLRLWLVVNIEIEISVNSVPPNFRYVAYEAGVRLGARKEWEFMWGKYQKEIVAEEKKKLLLSLTATREAWLLQRLVHL